MKIHLKTIFRRPGVPTVSRENPARNATSSEFEVDNWAVSEFVAAKLVPIVGWHPFPLHELMLMVATICVVEPAEIFEWGTHVGKSARVFHETVAHYRIEAVIYSTDLPDDAVHAEHPHTERGRMVRELPDVHLHQGDGLDVSLDLWRSGGRKPGPVFFLDGDHAYGSVFRELHAIAAEVHDATILVHDSFYQSPESGYNVGPHQAIESLIAAWPDRFRVLQSGLGLPGLTVLYPAAP